MCFGCLPQAAYVMSEYSYFHVGKITLQEVQPCVDKLYQTVEAQREETKADQVRMKEQLQTIVDKASIHTHKHKHRHTHAQTQAHTCTNTGPHMHKHRHSHARTQAHTCTNTGTHMYKHRHKHRHTHAQAPTQAHTCTHTMSNAQMD